LKSNDFALLARSMRTSTARPDVFSDADIAEYKTAWSRPGAPTAMLNYYRANILGRLFGKKTLPQKIDLPTLFIYGEKDMAVLPATVAGVGEIVSGRYTEHRIPDSGHWVQQEASDEVTRVIRGFLAL